MEAARDDTDWIWSLNGGAEVVFIKPDGPNKPSPVQTNHWFNRSFGWFFKNKPVLILGGLEGLTGPF